MKRKLEVLIHGEIGSGKTTLLLVLASLLEDLGYPVRCFDDGREIEAEHWPHPAKILSDVTGPLSTVHIHTVVPKR